MKNKIKTKPNRRQVGAARLQRIRRKRSRRRTLAEQLRHGITSIAVDADQSVYRYFADGTHERVCVVLTLREGYDTVSTHVEFQNQDRWERFDSYFRVHSDSTSAWTRVRELLAVDWASTGHRTIVWSAEVF